MIFRYFRTRKTFSPVLRLASTCQVERADSATPSSKGLPAGRIEAGPEPTHSTGRRTAWFQNRAVRDPMDPQRRSYRIRIDHGQLVRSCNELASHSGTQCRSKGHLDLVSPPLWRQAVVLRLPNHPLASIRALEACQS